MGCPPACSHEGEGRKVEAAGAGDEVSHLGLDPHHLVHAARQRRVVVRRDIPVVGQPEFIAAATRAAATCALKRASNPKALRRRIARGGLCLQSVMHSKGA